MIARYEALCSFHFPHSVCPLILYALLVKRIEKLGHKPVSSIVKQGAQWRHVVVPTPSLAPLQGVFYGNVGSYLSRNAVNARFPQCRRKRTHIVVPEHRVHSPLYIHIAFKHRVFHRPFRVKRRFKTVRPAQLLQRRNGRKHFLRACRAHGLANVPRINQRIGCNVIHTYSRERSFKHGHSHKAVYALPHPFRPRQKRIARSRNAVLRNRNRVVTRRNGCVAVGNRNHSLRPATQRKRYQQYTKSKVT